jgi:hypothetical protein
VRRRWWVAVLGAVVVAASVVAVGVARRSSEPGSGAADLGGGSAPAGAELADGLVVPTGATRVGPVFPHVASAADATPGWAAVLAVEGDVLAVWDDLAAQVRRLGARVPPSTASCVWWASSGTSGGYRGLTGAGAPDGTQALWCMAYAVAEAAPDGAVPDGEAPGEVPVVTAELWSDGEGAYLGIQVNRDPRPTSEWGRTTYGDDQLSPPTTCRRWLSPPRPTGPACRGPTARRPCGGPASRSAPRSTASRAGTGASGCPTGHSSWP